MKNFLEFGSPDEKDAQTTSWLAKPIDFKLSVSMPRYGWVLVTAYFVWLSTK